MNKKNLTVNEMLKKRNEQMCDEQPDMYSREPRMGQKAEDVLASARLRLLVDFPFFGKIAQNMPFVESDYIPTTAVDAKGNLYFNRYWVNAWRNMEEAMFEFAHETGHLYQRYFSRKPDSAIDMIFNLAADWRVDTDLKDAGLTPSARSRQMVPDEAMEKTRELGTIERIYQYLLREAEDITDCKACKEQVKHLKKMQDKTDKENQAENKSINGRYEENQDNTGEDEGNGESNAGEDEGNGESNAGEDEGKSEGEGEGSDSGNGTKLKHTCKNTKMCCVGSSADLENASPMDEQKWLELIIAAKMHAEGKGNMPSQIGESINGLTKNKVRWQDYLKSKSTKIFGRDRYSFRKYNRRGTAMNVRLPRALPDGRTAVISCDTSGSMSSDSIRQCISESAAIMKTCGASKVWLILHDYVVYFSDYVGEAELANLETRRGGTSHEAVFQALNREHPNDELNVPPEEDVELAIMFTDLGTTFPEYVPNFEVIWGVPDPSCPGMECEVPFGTKVPVDMSDYENH